MSELKQLIRQDLTAAMKAHDDLTKGALRMLLAAIQTEEVSGAKHALDDQGVLKLIAREIKKRHESAEVYAANGRQELADKELAEATVLEKYQPQQLNDEELAAVVDKAVAAVEAEISASASMQNMGQVMKAATAAAAGRADGKRLSTAVRERLQQG